MWKPGPCQIVLPISDIIQIGKWWCEGTSEYQQVWQRIRMSKDESKDTQGSSSPKPAYVLYQLGRLCAGPVHWVFSASVMEIICSWLQGHYDKCEVLTTVHDIASAMCNRSFSTRKLVLLYPVSGSKKKPKNKKTKNTQNKLILWSGSWDAEARGLWVWGNLVKSWPKKKESKTNSQPGIYEILSKRKERREGKGKEGGRKEVEKVKNSTILLNPQSPLP